jgi:LuxR family maltose regulon positive regulatory protein
MQIVSSKLEIPAAGAAIGRPRLLGPLLADIDSCSSTLVLGRAGTGKTTLVAQAARASGRRVAWLEVDAPDSDPAVFFSYLVEALVRQRPELGESLAPLAGATRRDDVSSLATLLVYSILETAGEPLLLVLDDLHNVYDAPWLATFLGRLLLVLPPDLHLIAIGRSTPPAPIWRLRSKQMLCHVDEEQLAFTRDEAERLFLALGAPEALAAGAVETCRGRAAALVALAEAAARERRERLRPDP